MTPDIAALTAIVKEFADSVKVRPSRDRFWLLQAQTYAVMADCSRRKVAAVLVDTDNRLRSAGYNGSAPGGPSCLAGGCPRGRLSHEELPGYAEGNHSYEGGVGDCIALHAELNAILELSRAQRKGATLYITVEPCAGCLKQLGGSGIARIVWLTGDGFLYERSRLPHGSWSTMHGVWRPPVLVREAA